MLGTKIVLATNPRGMFLEGLTANNTMKPGIAVEIQSNTALVNGEATWQALMASAGSTGDPRLNAILCEDTFQGVLASSNPATGAAGNAYASGVRCFVYVPYPGEFMNVLTLAEPGTGSANAFFIGNRLVANASTGKFTVQSTSSARAQFVCMEHIDQTPANTDTLVYSICAIGG